MIILFRSICVCVNVLTVSISTENEFTNSHFLENVTNYAFNMTWIFK